MADETEAPGTEVAEPVTDAPVVVQEPAAAPTIATADEWRRVAHRRWLVTLPSGVSVIARKPGMAAMLSDGLIDPETLLKMAERTKDRSELAGRVDVARLIAAAIVTAPVIVTTGEVPEGAIASADVPAADALALLAWAMGTAAGGFVTAVEAPDE